MNLRDLEYLIALAEKGHFGRAAEACHVSQPTLSSQVKKLEEYLGVVLFERSNKAVVITPVGAQVVEHARMALQQVRLLKEAAQAHRDPVSGPLRLGVIPTLSPYLMPLVLRPLIARHPKLRLVLSEEMTAALLQRLRRHEIDAALLATPLEDADLSAWPLFDEPFWLAHPRDHALYQVEEISAAHLEHVTLLLLADGHCLTDQVLDVCQQAVAREQHEFGDLRASSLETLLQLVGAGFGCTLVPALAMRGGWMTDSGIIARPLNLPGASRRVVLAHRRSFPRAKALEALATVILDHLPNTVVPIRAEPARALRKQDRATDVQ
jgi:LysR family hydrogen peroxide-inducible transcriptional activator